MIEFTIFDTGIGACGLAWGPRGIIAVQLPEATREKTRTRLLRRHPNAIDRTPPPHIAEVIQALTAHLAGESVSLSDIRVDLSGEPDFRRRVYAVARAIPRGATLTYGAVAEQLGDPLLAQAVGQALGKNPVPLIIPCHRVLAAGGKLGGFSGGAGTATKKAILLLEGALPDEPLDLFL